MTEVVVDHTDPSHGTYNGGTCDECDWCVRCEKITLWNAEVCRECGRVWGEKDER